MYTILTNIIYFVLHFGFYLNIITLSFETDLIILLPYSLSSFFY